VQHGVGMVETAHRNSPRKESPNLSGYSFLDALFDTVRHLPADRRLADLTGNASGAKARY
jgi:hypothetical protein